MVITGDDRCTMVGGRGGVVLGYWWGQLQVAAGSPGKSSSWRQLFSLSVCAYTALVGISNSILFGGALFGAKW